MDDASGVGGSGRWANRLVMCCGPEQGERGGHEVGQPGRHRPYAGVQGPRDSLPLCALLYVVLFVLLVTVAVELCGGGCRRVQAVEQVERGTGSGPVRRNGGGIA